MELKDFRRELSGCFDSIVTVDKLKSAGGSKTVRHAKAAAVYLARKDGHSNDEIAAAFGYSSGKSVSNVFSRVNGEIGLGTELDHDIRRIADKLGIGLE